MKKHSERLREKRLNLWIYGAVAGGGTAIKSREIEINTRNW
jgi:hypothetical protein